MLYNKNIGDLLSLPTTGYIKNVTVGRTRNEHNCGDKNSQVTKNI
jgi:hypothetical protein